MNNSRRIQRVSSLLKKEISHILMNDLEGNLIVDNFVSITKIEISIDLQYCKVYVSSTAGSDTNQAIVENLNLSKSLIRHHLSKRVQMRRIPEIVFKLDTVFEEGLSVLKLLDELRGEENKNHSKIVNRDNENS
tara:strand:- start:252 stop:653 length:402 start_codon:yes stop_codon:yes gene_type:complete